MKTKLKNIAKIQLGYSFRSKIQKNFNGNMSIIQMKDLTEDYRVNINHLDKIELHDSKSHHEVKKDDIIFKARGSDATACLFESTISDVILTAPLLRIRIKSKNILPEYIFWYLNQKTAQTFLKKRMKGTSQKMINKQSLEELEIEIPDVKKQQQIVEIAQLAEKEQKLLENLRNKKYELISTILLNQVKENNNGNKSSKR